MSSSDQFDRESSTADLSVSRAGERGATEPHFNTLTTVDQVQDKLVWIDCEMTGLRLGTDKLIEVAALVTDSELNVLGEGVDIVIHADDAALDGMSRSQEPCRWPETRSPRIAASSRATCPNSTRSSTTE